MQQGFIVIHRKITENWLWLSEPFSKAQAWIDLLLIANHDNNSFFIRDIKRGQIGGSEESIALRWKWSRNKLRTFLKLLENEQQIKQHRSNIINIIEITNYDNYQNLNNRKDNRKTTEKQQKGQQKDTNNECIINEKQCIINENKDNEEKYFYDKLPDFIDKKMWTDFIDFRISIETKSKPFTNEAKNLLIKKLSGFEKVAKGNANLALENSIVNSWQGVFEPRQNNFNNNKKPVGMPQPQYDDPDYYKNDGGWND